jgi:diaminopimelate decarboxylase
MNYFQNRNDELFAEDVRVQAIADAVGTPCYIYSKATLERHWRAFDQALASYPHHICYAVKANSNIAVLQVLARLGSWFDIVSRGELERVLVAGGAPERIVFSGVGKQVDEIARALDVGIYCFNVESAEECERIRTIARKKNKIAAISLRVNPNVDAKTHPYIATGLKENKFGIASSEALAFYQSIHDDPHVRIVGIGCHIGSQLVEVTPFIEALACLLDLVQQLKKLGIELQHLDLGGGLGVHYRNEQPPEPADYAQQILPLLANSGLTLLIEPGRAIAANAGILVTKVEYLKQTPDRHFAIVDAGMNDLLRPALYQAWHDIVPVMQKNDAEVMTYDVVGPVCETSDFLGLARPLRIRVNDYLAVRTAGAYGFVMSSNYNTRPRCAEVMVDGAQFKIVRQRETLTDCWAHESLLQDN